jgi:prepilin-type N-terminal cleavage/methylation domain-containing protein
MKREVGFSLIELLVAMAVTLIIVAATLSLFENALRTNETSQQLSNMDGNLRGAMNLITRDLLQAGQGIPTGGVAVPSGAGCTPVNRPVPVGTATFPYGCGVASTPTLPAVIPGNAMGPAVPDVPPASPGNLGSPNLSWVPSPGPESDIITMMYQDNTLITSSFVNAAIFTPNYLITLTNNSMTFSNAQSITGSSNSVNVGDIFLVTGSTASGPISRYVVITQTTAGSQTVNFSGGGADAFNLNQQGSAASGTIDDLNSGGASFGLACPQPGALPNPYGLVVPAACLFYAQRVVMVSYWLDITQSVNGLVVPRLMRQVGLASAASCAAANPPLNGCPRPVAEVIEGLELSYDYVNGTAPINNQVSSVNANTACGGCGITDNQIRKVNLYLAGRSDARLSQTGQFMRTNLARQVDIRSLAFVSKYQ